MCRALLIWCLLLAGVVCVAQSEHVSAFWQSRDSNYNQNIVSGGFTPSCSQSSNYLGRATDIVLTADKTAFDTFICGGVTDGWFAKTGIAYVSANVTEAAFEQNLISSSFTATKTGSVAFSAYNGVTSDGSTGFYNTNYNPTAAGIAGANSISLSFCTVATISGNQIPIGSYDGSVFLWAQIETGSNGYQVFLNDNSGTNNTGNWTTGLWTGARAAASGAGAVNIYNNGILAGTGTTASSGNLSNKNLYLLARNNNGTADSFTNYQMAFFASGANYTLTDAANLQTRLNALLNGGGNFNISGC